MARRNNIDPDTESLMARLAIMADAARKLGEMCRMQDQVLKSQVSEPKFVLRADYIEHSIELPVVRAD